MEIKARIKSLLKLFFSGNEKKIIFQLQLAKYFKTKRKLRITRYLHRRMQKYGIYISEKSVIDSTVHFPHPVGIVIGEGVHIGKNVKIFQNVTLGGARVGDQKNGKYPKIGDGVVIFAGAVIVGDIQIGDNAIIGANSVVLKDVPPGKTCVGVPGRVIEKPDPFKSLSESNEDE